MNLKRKIMGLVGIKLPENWPIEWSPVEKYVKIFQQYGLYMGRLVSSSKSSYFGKHPDNVIVFNGNILTKKSGKVWYGDIDITVSFDKLKDIANQLGEDLYILRELDARFGKENKSLKALKKLAVVIIKASK